MFLFCVAAVNTQRDGPTLQSLWNIFWRPSRQNQAPDNVLSRESIGHERVVEKNSFAGGGFVIEFEPT